MNSFFKSKSIWIIFLASTLGFIIACNNNSHELKNMTVVFYNVENLFDTINEPGKNDAEFTPDSTKKWNNERYNKKLNDLAKVLSSVNENELPEIIGLCEVENKAVIRDLVKTDLLADGKYRIVHYESPDFRGIDNALIYRPEEFKVINSSPIGVSFENDPDYVTRDILYVKGKTKNKEIFHIFVNHWPSRIGGEEQTEPKRVRVASILRNKVDSLVTAEGKPNIIILGDMNDEPSNNSLLNTLKAKDPESEPGAGLNNMMFKIHKQDFGSYNFRGKWNMLDNIVVSGSLLDDKGFRCAEKQGFVFHKEWMEYKSNNGTISPNRTYGGPNYYGGISDHFPVYINLSR